MSERLSVVEVTGHLGIGGVETHVSRLARGLMRRGHDVILLAQRSGVHGDEAREAGAEILEVPFNREGREEAVDQLQREDIDLVHAHNYRAARFAAPLARELGVPYVMTVHGPRPWYQRALFRSWSDPVLTVSDADRENITGRFGVPADRVIVGFLGVDTERFRPGLDASSLRAEWELPADAPLIVNVSRFSHRKARPALALIEALPLVRQQIPDARLVFVGSGPELNAIAAEAEEYNRAAGTRAAVAVGARTDIPLVLNTADVAVATATTALEALACATPTLAFGRTGYFGLITEDNLEQARAVCFADHGHLPRGETDHLVSDLVELLADLSSARRRAEAIRQTVVERYSVERMVQQIERVYRRLTGSEQRERAGRGAEGG